MPFIPHFYLFLMNTSIQVQISHLEAFQAFGNVVGPSEFWGSGFRWEDLMLIRFCLQMLNNKMLKPNNEILLKCAYKLDQKTIKLQLIKRSIPWLRVCDILTKKLLKQ